MRPRQIPNHFENRWGIRWPCEGQRSRLRNEGRGKGVPKGAYRSTLGNRPIWAWITATLSKGHRKSRRFLHDSSVYREAFPPAGTERHCFFVNLTRNVVLSYRKGKVSLIWLGYRRAVSWGFLGNRPFLAVSQTVWKAWTFTRHGWLLLGTSEWTNFMRWNISYFFGYFRFEVPVRFDSSYSACWLFFFFLTNIIYG